jgi:hypothetical protein
MFLSRVEHWFGGCSVHHHKLIEFLPGFEGAKVSLYLVNCGSGSWGGTNIRAVAQSSDRRVWSEDHTGSDIAGPRFKFIRASRDCSFIEDIRSRVKFPDSGKQSCLSNVVSANDKGSWLIEIEPCKLGQCSDNPGSRGQAARKGSQTQGGCAGDSATRANEPQANTPLDHEKRSPSGVKSRQGSFDSISLFYFIVGTRPPPGQAFRR